MRNSSSLSSSRSLELQLSSMTVSSSSPSLNRAPSSAITVGPEASDSNTLLLHPFAKSHAHLVDDESSNETESMRYSPPSPSTSTQGSGNFRASMPMTATQDSMSKTNNNMSSSSSSNRVRQGSYPSPIGRNSASIFGSSGNSNNSPSTRSPGSTTLEAGLSSNLFSSKNMSFHRDIDTHQNHLNNLSSNANDKIEFFEQSSASTEIGDVKVPGGQLSNRAGLNTDINVSCYSPSAQSPIHKHKQTHYSPSAIGSLHFGTANANQASYDNLSTKSPAKNVRKLGSDFLQQVSPSPSGIRSRTLAAPGSSNTDHNHIISSVIHGSWDENHANANHQHQQHVSDNSTGFLESNSNLSTGKASNNRNLIFPGIIEERSLLTTDGEFNSQGLTGIKDNNSNTHLQPPVHTNLGTNNNNNTSLYSNNKNTFLKDSPASNVSGNFNSRFTGQEGENRGRGPEFSGGVYSNNNSNHNNSNNFNVGMRGPHYGGPPPRQQTRSVSEGLGGVRSDQFRTDTSYDNNNSNKAGGNNSFQGNFRANDVPSGHVRAVSFNSSNNTMMPEGMSRVNTGHLDQHGNVGMYESSAIVPISSDGSINGSNHGNPMMYREGVNRNRMDGNGLRGQLPPTHSHHQHQTDFQGPDSRLQQPFEYKSSRPPMQIQNQMTHLFNQMHHHQLHPQQQQQQVSGRQQPHISRSQQAPGYHPQQHGYNQNMLNDFNRRNHFVDERHIQHPMANQQQGNLGLPPPQFDQRQQRISPHHQQLYSNQENHSIGRLAHGVPPGGMYGGNTYIPNSSGLPPRHDDYENYSNMGRSATGGSMSNNRVGMEIPRHHRNLSGSSLENSSQGSVIGMGAGNPQQGAPYHGGRGIHRSHHSDYRGESVGGLYSPGVHTPPEEPVMNANDGDPYSVGISSHVQHRQRMNSGAVSSDGMHHNSNFMSTSSSMQTIRSNNEIERGGDINSSIKGLSSKIPMNPSLPYGHTLTQRRNNFEIAHQDEMDARTKLSSGMSHQQHFSTMPGPPQSFTRSCQGSDSSTSMDQGGPNVYSRDGHMPSPSNLNSGPRLVYNIKFKRTQRSFILGLRAPRDIKIGCYVKVEADRGEDLGFVVSRMSADKYNTSGRSNYRLATPNSSGNDSSCHSTSSIGGGGAADLKQVIRLATHDEVNHLNVKREEEDDLLKICRTKVKQRNLPMTVCDAEYQFDRNKLTFFFEAEGRIDFRELVRDLFSIYKTRIWMQQLDKNGGAGSNSSTNSANGENSVS